MYMRDVSLESIAVNSFSPKSQDSPTRRNAMSTLIVGLLTGIVSGAVDVLRGIAIFATVAVALRLSIKACDSWHQKSFQGGTAFWSLQMLLALGAVLMIHIILRVFP